MVHLDTALGEQFLDVAVGQAIAQVPADRQDDGVGWEAEASEGRSCSGSRARAARSHAICLAAQAWPGERNSPRCGSSGARSCRPNGARGCSPPPSAESARERDSGDYLFHEPEAQPNASPPATLPRPPYVATTRVQVDGSVIQAIIRGPCSRCQQQRPVDRDGGSYTLRSGVL